MVSMSVGRQAQTLLWEGGTVYVFVTAFFLQSRPAVRRAGRTWHVSTTAQFLGTWEGTWEGGKSVPSWPDLSP